MLNLPAQPMRPSTSPTPNFVFADLKKIASYGSAGPNKLPRGMAAASAAAPAAAALSRLRPLPASSQGPRTNGFMGGGMMIEGAKTGEEKLVSVVERRESVAVKPSAPLDTGVAKENAVQRDLVRIKKLENDIRKLQEQLKKRTQEKEEETRRADDFQHLLDSANRKLSDRETELTEELRRRQTQVEHFRSTCEELEKKLRQIEDDHASSTSGSRSAAERHAQELRDAQAQLERLRSDMNAQLDSLRNELRQQKEQTSVWEKKSSAQAAEAAQRDTRHEREMAAARADSAKIASECDGLRRDMCEKDKMVDDWKQKMDQCRNYIVKICQPKFSVVKDDSLAPVQPGSQEAGGFVLVPLQLMLEGYTLLPGDMKKKIAEEYESSKKKR